MFDFGATVWVHGSKGSRLVDRVELLSVSGRDIGVDFLMYMADRGDDPYVMERFSTLKPETPYQVLGRYWWADGEFDLELTSWVECPADEVIDKVEPDLWEMLVGASGQRLQELPF